MKLRAKHGFYNDRQQTQCICEWCGEPFLSQRSDSKFCCDSHKTLACNKRYKLKLEKKRDVEKIRHYQPAPVNVPPVKPKVEAAILNRESEGLSDEQMQKLTDEVNSMIQNFAKEAKQREEKMAIEDVARRLTGIGEDLKEWLRRGFIRRSQLVSLERMVKNLADEPNARRLSQFQEHMNFLSESLLPYVKETKTKFFEEGVYRLPEQLPDNIKGGIPFLLVPLPVRL